MTTSAPIKTLFANDIHRRIEEVIKVDQTSEEVIRDEINEYVVTDAIRSHYTGIFDAYREMPNKPHEGIAIWVSGFFGSGKSSFAKMLGLSIGNPEVAGESASERFAQRAGDNKLSVLLKTINEKIPMVERRFHLRGWALLLRRILCLPAHARHSLPTQDRPPPT